MFAVTANSKLDEDEKSRYFFNIDSCLQLPKTITKTMIEKMKEWQWNQLTNLHLVYL